MNFWENYLSECTKIDKSPNAVAKELGIASGSVTAWKNGTVPHTSTLNKIAEYFGVTVAYLLGYEKSPAGAELSEKDKKLVDAYHKSEPVIQATVDRILGIEEKTYTVKVAARNGGPITEKTLTEEEYQRLMNLPDVEDI